MGLIPNCLLPPPGLSASPAPIGTMRTGEGVRDPAIRAPDSVAMVKQFLNRFDFAGIALTWLKTQLLLRYIKGQPFSQCTVLPSEMEALFVWIF